MFFKPEWREKMFSDIFDISETKPKYSPPPTISGGRPRGVCYMRSYPFPVGTKPRVNSRRVKKMKCSAMRKWKRERGISGRLSDSNYILFIKDWGKQ